jgi:cytochrome c oxidase subunit 2
MRRGSLLQMIGLAAVLFAIVTAVALFIPWMPTAASKEADRIWLTYWVATWMSIAIFSVVMAALIFAVIKFRAKDGDMSDGPPVHGHTGLEIVWTTVPFILVTALSVIAAVVTAQNSNAGKDPLIVKATAQQFAWQFTYPNDQTYGELRLPKDRTVKLLLTSNDVIHSFWVPQFGQKQDAVPGQVFPLVITPTRLGTYPLICTELCGLGHALMRSRAIVMTPDEYESWYAGSAAAEPSSGSATASPVALFTTTCGGCHAFAPAKTVGQAGPSLGDLAAHAAAAGQPLEEYVRQSIVDPEAYLTPGYTVGGVMPATYGTQLTADQISQLVQYLVENSN